MRLSLRENTELCPWSTRQNAVISLQMSNGPIGTELMAKPTDSLAGAALSAQLDPYYQVEVLFQQIELVRQVQKSIVGALDRDERLPLEERMPAKDRADLQQSIAKNALV